MNRQCHVEKGWCFAHHQWWSACKQERATRAAQTRAILRRMRGEPLKRFCGIKMSETDFARLEAAAIAVKLRPSALAREAIRVATGNILDRRVRVREKHA